MDVQTVTVNGQTFPLSSLTKTQQQALQNILAPDEVTPFAVTFQNEILSAHATRKAAQEWAEGSDGTEVVSLLPHQAVELPFMVTTRSPDGTGRVDGRFVSREDADRHARDGFVPSSKFTTNVFVAHHTKREVFCYMPSCSWWETDRHDVCPTCGSVEWLLFDSETRQQYTLSFSTNGVRNLYTLLDMVDFEAESESDIAFQQDLAAGKVVAVNRQDGTVVHAKFDKDFPLADRSSDGSISAAYRTADDFPEHGQKSNPFTFEGVTPLRYGLLSHADADEPSVLYAEKRTAHLKAAPSRLTVVDLRPSSVSAGDRKNAARAVKALLDVKLSQAYNIVDGTQNPLDLPMDDDFTVGDFQRRKACADVVQSYADRTVDLSALATMVEAVIRQEFPNEHVTVFAAHHTHVGSVLVKFDFAGHRFRYDENGTFETEIRNIETSSRLDMPDYPDVHRHAKVIVSKMKGFLAS